MGYYVNGLFNGKLEPKPMIFPNVGRVLQISKNLKPGNVLLRPAGAVHAGNGGEWGLLGFS